MADRVSVTIRIGGGLTRALFADLEAAITSDDAAIDWEGTPFSIEDLPIDAPSRSWRARSLGDASMRSRNSAATTV